MATTDTKPGFRLPWTSDRGEADPDRAPADATTESGDPVAEETDAAAMIDVEPATADQVETTGTADFEPAQTESPSASADAAVESAPGAESAPVAEPARAAGARKPSKFLADLTKAMQATAEAARDETMERFAAEAKAASERVHADAAEEVTDLRRNADDDVASIRDWSKGEIARIREETETKISARKTDLEGELEAHNGVVERRVERVSAAVAAFEREMQTFFERLLAEDDPSAFATMAERIPEPPSLDGSGTDEYVPAPVAQAAVVADEPAEAAVEASTEAPEAETPAEAVAETVADSPSGQIDDAAAAEAEAAIEADDPRLSMIGAETDFDAAEAEAAMSAAEAEVSHEEPGDIPAIAEEVVAARLAGLVPPSEGNPEQQTARVVVTGLVSVASIAGFKRGLARTSGVGAVGVTSGPDGEFVFNVSYAADIDLKAAIAALPGFDAKVTNESADGFEVAARDPEARD